MGQVEMNGETWEKKGRGCHGREHVYFTGSESAQRSVQEMDCWMCEAATACHTSVVRWERNAGRRGRRRRRRRTER